MIKKQKCVSNDDAKEEMELSKSVHESNARICSPSKFLGVFYALLSSVLFSINALLVKMIDLHSMQLAMSRVYVQFLILLPLIFYKRKTVDLLGPDGLKKFLWLRGLMGSLAVIFIYMAINILPLGNAITITYLSMMLVPFIARIFLKEKLTATDMIFAVVSLVGVTLVSEPTFIFPEAHSEKNDNYEIGIIFAFMAALTQAITIVVLRKLGKTYAPLSVLYHSSVGSILTTVVVVISGTFEYPCLSEIPYVFGLGITGILGQYFLTLALSLERAGTVSVLRSLQIIIVYILQIAALGSIPSLVSVIGASLVLSGCIGIGICKVLSERNGQRRK